MGEVAIGAARRRRSDASHELERLLSQDLIEPAYQPIVKLHDETVVAFEALARAPESSLLSMPAALFGAAARCGRLQELDWACRAAAIRGAFGADYLPPAALFVNVEPVAAGQLVPQQYEQLMARAQTGLRVVFEFTERALTDYPSDVLCAVHTLRELGALIALDDVGVDPRSLALLPFLEPEVVKLDMSLVHDVQTPTALETFCAVSAYAERTGAVVIAEGIESDEHLRAAIALGANYGQGWRFGKPGPLPSPGDWQPVEMLRASTHSATPAKHHPFTWLARQSAPDGVVGRAGLSALWEHLIGDGRALGSSAVVLACPGSLGDDAVAGLTDAAQVCAFVGALVGSAARTPARVRHGRIDEHDPLQSEICLCVLAPHYAAVLAARQGSPHDDSFEYRISHDRDLTAAVARGLIGRIGPSY